jgi:hypothetical protein
MALASNATTCSTDAVHQRIKLYQVLFLFPCDLTALSLLVPLTSPFLPHLACRIVYSSK